MYMAAWLEPRLVVNGFVDDRWPVLQKLPRALAPWRAKFDRDREVLDAIANAWWTPAKESVKNGTAVPCFATKFVETYESQGWTEQEAALITLGLLIAGAGTTASAQNYLVMGCLVNPEAVKKAHEELDRVVGPDRLPTLDDEPNLPYIRAMVKECLRWRPFSNAGKHGRP